ncbi:MAG TPA: S41 family peptidase [Steroidobacteraceae bacterium]|nr:S41 family peptidase [Steroidobacteraceae bacterium]HRX89401.1 S41 family peptidase [Steroidobacteraceae bacterium]
MRRTTILLLTSMLVASCGGGGDAPGPGSPGGNVSGVCGTQSQKQFVLDRAREWYLFVNTLPTTVQLSQYSSADDLLDALTATARAQNRDRFFSYLTSIADEQRFFTAGESVGFGIGTIIRDSNTRLFITQVFENSAAASAGFARGDEVLALGTSSSTLEQMSTLLARPNGFSDAVGPAEAGITRVFRVRTLSGTTVERSVTKRSYSLNPVPANRLIARSGLSPLGYVQLRTFVSTADAQLRSAFATLRANNVRDVVLDLRYNGGGLVATAELLSDLLADGKAGQLQYRTRLNPAKSSEQIDVAFRNRAEAIPALRIAFLTTGSSASASELVINSLAPYADVAIIGAPTFGKPVGQFAFDLASSCDLRLRLVTFQNLNRDGTGDYFGGLPDANYNDTFCAASDDLTRPQDDSAEAMTATAIAWLNDGVCPVSATATPLVSKPLRDELGLPAMPAKPSFEQRLLPGTY